MTAHDDEWAVKTARFRIPGMPRFAEMELIELGDKVIAEKDDEITRLKTDGSPGVMHEIDRMFYDLTIQERDYSRRQVANRDTEIAQLRLRQAELASELRAARAPEDQEAPS